MLGSPGPRGRVHSLRIGRLKSVLGASTTGASRTDSNRCLFEPRVFPFVVFRVQPLDNSEPTKQPRSGATKVLRAPGLVNYVFVQLPSEQAAERCRPPFAVPPSELESLALATLHGSLVDRSKVRRFRGCRVCLLRLASFSR
jgi:hypothetical protein